MSTAAASPEYLAYRKLVDAADELLREAKVDAVAAHGFGTRAYHEVMRAARAKHAQITDAAWAVYKNS